MPWHAITMSEMIGVTWLNEKRAADNSLSCQISIAVGNFCSHGIIVVLGQFQSYAWSLVLVPWVGDIYPRMLKRISLYQYAHQT
jgi:hypothetical protein